MKKAPLHGAFFIALLFWAGGLWAACPSWSQGGIQEVARLYDGDTLKLADGRKVRLIGINTPELGHGRRDDEPVAEAARSALADLLRESGDGVRLLPGRDPKDRYKRTLAHIFSADGENLTERLLASGMGWQVVIPPNLRYLDCYRAAEQRARDARLGVWRQPPLEADGLTGREAGFHLLRGEIERVGRSRSALWLNLRGGLALRIDWDDWRYFREWDGLELEGRRLEVRGWISRHKGRQRMRLRHPAALRWLD